MAEIFHIASLVVHAHPSHRDKVHRWLESQPDTEIATSSDEGKLVVVVERSHERELLAFTDSVRDREGVLGAALIYHEMLENPDEQLADGSQIIASTHSADNPPVPQTVTGATS